MFRDSNRQHEGILLAEPRAPVAECQFQKASGGKKLVSCFQWGRGKGGEEGQGNGQWANLRHRDQNEDFSVENNTETPLPETMWNLCVGDETKPRLGYKIRA